MDLMSLIFNSQYSGYSTKGLMVKENGPIPMKFGEVAELRMTYKFSPHNISEFFSLKKFSFFPFF